MILLFVGRQVVCRLCGRCFLELSTTIQSLPQDSAGVFLSGNDIEENIVVSTIPLHLFVRNIAAAEKQFVSALQLEVVGWQQNVFVTATNQQGDAGQ